MIRTLIDPCLRALATVACGAFLAGQAAGEGPRMAPAGAHHREVKERSETKRPSARRATSETRRSTPVESVRAANAAATLEPVAAGYINAGQVFPFAEGAVYAVYAAPERVTDISLQPGEALVSVAAGDTARWLIGDTTSGTGASKRSHILIKPFAPGLATNVVIATDRRTYHLALASTGGTAMTALSWTYPGDGLIAVKAPPAEQASDPVAVPKLPVERLQFGYALSGGRPNWRPLRVFDDGRQTYIEFPPSLAVGEAPPLFLVDQKGEAQLVNYRLAGRFYVVDRLFDAAELRLGLKRQQIVRITRLGDATHTGKAS